MKEMSMEFLSNQDVNTIVAYKDFLEETLISYEPLMRKPTICICENKDADQLRGNRKACLFVSRPQSAEITLWYKLPQVLSK